MKILFITPVVPTESDGRRPYNFLKYLSTRHQVSLLCLRLPVQKSQDVERIAAMGVRVQSLPIHSFRSLFQSMVGLFARWPIRASWCYSRCFRRLVQETLARESFDIVHFDRMRMGQYADCVPGPKVLDFTDSLSLYLKRSVVFRRKWGERAIDMWEQKTIPAFEQRVLDQVDCGLLCSTVDARFFRTLHPRGRIEVIENAVDPNQFAVQTHTSGHRPRCIITGTLFYFPNIDSIRYYAEAILPALRRTFPEMETLLIGTRPTAEIHQLDGKNGIRVLANVPSMQDHLFMDDIYVCPLRVAAGVRNKLLEAMAAEMPIVSTRLGAEGMAVHEGRELLFAEDQEAFILQIRRLIEDRSFARDLGKRGRAYIETHHSLEVIGAKLEQLYTELQSSSSTF